MKILSRFLLILSLALPAPLAAQEDSAPPRQVAINLSGLVDWGAQLPFINVFKTARPWIGHRKHGWGGANYDELLAAGYLDENGWPVSIPPELGSVGTLMMTHLPEDAADVAGSYRLTFEGNGIVEVAGRATNVRYGRNEIRFDFTPGEGWLEVRIQRTDRAGTGDYVRNIQVIKDEHADAYARGEIFNPYWLNRLQGFGALRFMDWMNTNNSQQQHWRDRPEPGDFSWTVHGAPVEIMLRLANHLDADPWFTLPHKADDDYARRFAGLVKEGLEPGLKAYLEYSNEVWNWQFQQAGWANEQAQLRWNASDSWLEFYAARAIEIAAIWTEVFGEEATDRLVRVISSQTGWLGLEFQVMEAPRWRQEEPGRPRPADLFDAYAITGYFGHSLGVEDNAEMVRGWIRDSRRAATEEADRQKLTGPAREEYLRKHQFDLATEKAWDELLDGLISGNPVDSVGDLLNRLIPYHADIARDYGLDLIAYEGGTHVVGIGPMVDDDEMNAFFYHLNYSPEMGLLYQELLAGWAAQSDGIFALFNDVTVPSKWGSWGSLRHLSDSSPRWDAIEAAK
jgi:hypothetical protein